jgi:Na+-driven multidrug efflux pump
MKYLFTNFCKETGKNKNIFYFSIYLTVSVVTSNPLFVYFRAKEQEYAA